MLDDWNHSFTPTNQSERPLETSKIQPSPTLKHTHTPLCSQIPLTLSYSLTPNCPHTPTDCAEGGSIFLTKTPQPYAHTQSQSSLSHYQELNWWGEDEISSLYSPNMRNSAAIRCGTALTHSHEITCVSSWKITVGWILQEISSPPTSFPRNMSWCGKKCHVMAKFDQILTLFGPFLAYFGIKNTPKRANSAKRSPNFAKTCTHTF